MTRFASLGALVGLTLCLGALSSAQAVGMPNPWQGNQGVGMPGGKVVPPTLPEGGFMMQFGGLSNGGVPPVMRGTCPGVSSVQANIVQTENEWIMSYLKLTQSNQVDDYAAPNLADFATQNLAIIRLPNTLDRDAFGAVESIGFDPNVGATVIRYVVFVPQRRHRDSQNRDGQAGNNKAPNSQPTNQPATQPSSQSGNQPPRAMVKPQANATIKPVAPSQFLVVRYQRTAGTVRFVGRYQPFRPYNDGDPYYGG